ncbi:unnamed protein product [Toxocara canis]|uniref:Ovule protein n=1 Tax=Toxocara canis TaxID=6265 RepID=A0A183U9R0_TOXCA|nr:unnamed protein product [Toxocara canis]
MVMKMPATPIVANASSRFESHSMSMLLFRVSKRQLNGKMYHRIPNVNEDINTVSILMFICIVIMLEDAARLQ